jgi:hypothetical protein
MPIDQYVTLISAAGEDECGWEAALGEVVRGRGCLEASWGAAVAVARQLCHTQHENCASLQRLPSTQVPGQVLPYKILMESATATSKGAEAVGGAMLLILPSRGNGQNPDIYRVYQCSGFVVLMV